jgi:hypothetical protein
MWPFIRVSSLYAVVKIGIRILLLVRVTRHCILYWYAVVSDS